MIRSVSEQLFDDGNPDTPDIRVSVEIGTDLGDTVSIEYGEHVITLGRNQLENLLKCVGFQIHFGEYLS